MDASPRRGPPRLPEVLNDTMGQKRRKEHGKENITAPEVQIALKSTPERKRARLSGPPKPPRTSRVSLGVEVCMVSLMYCKYWWSNVSNAISQNVVLSASVLGGRGPSRTWIGVTATTLSERYCTAGIWFTGSCSTRMKGI